MSTHYTKNADGKIDGIMTVVSIYKFGGFIFEFSDFLGPLKLKKDTTPAAKMGRSFFKVYEQWSKLTKEQKDQTLIFGQPQNK